MTAEMMPMQEKCTFPIIAQKVKQYLADLGVEVGIDFERDRLYVISITPPLGILVPKREGGLYLEPGRKVYV